MTDFLLDLQLKNAKKALQTAKEMKKGKSEDDAQRIGEESSLIFE